MTHTTTCSDCWIDLTIDRDQGSVTAQVPSNGLRGSKHVPAHQVDTAILSDDGDLITWDCPACGHADSLDLTDLED